MVERPNLFVKIPATEAGLPAIEETIAARHPGQRHADLLARAPPRGGRGLHRRPAAPGRQRRRPVDASRRWRRFFVSRVDTEADKRLDEIGGHDELKGTLAIANAKLAYRTYEEVFSGREWEALAAKGATPQRCLWASTSTKNPDYRDVIYVEELIGPTRSTRCRARPSRRSRTTARSRETLDARRRRRRAHARGLRRGRDRLRRRRRHARARGRREVRQVLPATCSRTSRPSATRWWRHEPGRSDFRRARPAAARGLGPRQRRRRLGPPDVLDVGRRPDGRAARRPPAARLPAPGRSAQRPPDLLQGPRLAAVLLGAQGGRGDRRRRAADVPQARHPARGPPDAAHPADRRGDRLARPGPADRRRRRAGRQAARPPALPRLVPVRRLRDGRGLDVGGVRARRLRRARQPGRDHRRQPARPDARDDGRLGPRRATSAAPRRSAGTRSRSTATTSTRSRPPTREAEQTTGKPTAIIARTKKGKGVKAVEDQPGKHGKPLDDPEEAIAGARRRARPVACSSPSRRAASRTGSTAPAASCPTWELGERGRHAQGLRRGAGRARLACAATSSRSTARSRTRRTPRSSARRIPTATSRCSSPSSRWSPPPSACRCAAGCRSPRRSRRSSRAPTTSSAWRRSRARTSACRARTPASRSARTARRRWRSRTSRRSARSTARPSCTRATPTRRRSSSPRWPTARASRSSARCAARRRCARRRRGRADRRQPDRPRRRRRRDRRLRHHRRRGRRGGRGARAATASRRACSTATRSSRSTPRRVRAAARDCGAIVTVEDHWPEGGLGDAVLDALADADDRPPVHQARGARDARLGHARGAAGATPGSTPTAIAAAARGAQSAQRV